MKQRNPKPMFMPKTEIRAHLEAGIREALTLRAMAARLWVTHERVRQLLHSFKLYARWIKKRRKSVQRAVQKRRTEQPALVVERWKQTQRGKLYLEAIGELRRLGFDVQVKATDRYVTVFVDGLRLRLSTCHVLLPLNRGTSLYWRYRLHDVDAVYLVVVPSGERRIYWPREHGRFVIVRANAYRDEAHEKLGNTLRKKTFKPRLTWWARPQGSAAA